MQIEFILLTIKQGKSVTCSGLGQNWWLPVPGVCTPRTQRFVRHSAVRAVAPGYHPPPGGLVVAGFRPALPPGLFCAGILRGALSIGAMHPHVPN